MNQSSTSRPWRPRNRDIVARWIYGHFTIYIALSASIAPDGISWLVLHLAGPLIGQAAICVTGTIAILVIADVLINDVMPERYRFEWIRHQRHWLYTISAFLFLVPVFAAAKYHVSAIPQVWLFVGMAGWGLVLAYREAFRRRSPCD